MNEFVTCIKPIKMHAWETSSSTIRGRTSASKEPASECALLRGAWAGVLEGVGVGPSELLCRLFQGLQRVYNRTRHLSW